MPTQPHPVRYKFIDDFKEDIQSMVDAGNEDKAFKISSSKMKDRQRISYSKRFDVARKYHIGSYVSSYQGVGGRKAVEGDGDDDQQELVSGRMAIRYVKCLEFNVRGNMHIKNVFIESALMEKDRGFHCRDQQR